MDKRFKQTLMVVAFGVVLFVALSHLNVVRDFCMWLWMLAFPVVLGAIIAFFLNEIGRASCRERVYVLV